VRGRLTYSNGVATVALFLALGGGAVWAAGRIGSDDIATNAVRARHIATNAVGRSEIAPNAISGVIAEARGGPMPPPPGIEHLALSGDTTFTLPANRTAQVIVATRFTLARQAATCQIGVNPAAVSASPHLGGETAINVANTNANFIVTQKTQSFLLSTFRTPLAFTLDAEISGGDCAPGSQLDAIRFEVVAYR
jgi:hypothetical protein